MKKKFFRLDEHAAVSRLAKTLGRLVTPGFIDEIASELGIEIEGSSKFARMTNLLALSWETVLEGKAKRRDIASLIATIVMEGYNRFQSGALKMTQQDVDDVAADMQVLGLRPGGLADKGWRGGLPLRSGPGHIEQTRNTPTGPRPTSYSIIVAEIQTLMAGLVSPQARGKRLEELVHEVLAAEGLVPRGPMRNPGEELDRSFILDNHTYLLECRWEKDAIGFPGVRDFMAKVGAKAEGTFGVVLSMSGFVADINTSAAHGRRLNSIGITGTDLMDVLEGRVTFTDLTRAARRYASERSLFLRAQE